MVEIEKEIFLITGRPDLPAWLKTIYLDYKQTSRADHQYVELFQQVDDQGGNNPHIQEGQHPKLPNGRENPPPLTV